MKKASIKRLIVHLVSAVALVAAADAGSLNTARIDELTGIKGKLNDGVYRITFPRNDVAVAVAGWKMPPFMGLGTWAAFTSAQHTEAMVMGDTVLFEDEVNAALSVALENGLSVTALHNHFFFDHPKVYFMHISGEGTVDQLASAVRKLYDKIKEVRAATPAPKNSFGGNPIPEKSAISPEPLNAVFGQSGEVNNGMVKFTIGQTTKMDGIEVGKDMGVNTWAAFAGTDENAIVDGDFAVTEEQLQPVLRTLRAAGINIVAIHTHMTGEEPRVMFFHYWGQGAARQLAEAVKSGLRQVTQ